METVKTWMRHNQGIFVALVIVVILLLWNFGCESKVGSLVKPEKLVNRAELAIEVESEQARLENELGILSKAAEAKFTELDRQEEIKAMLMNFGLVAAETGKVNPAGIVGLLASILGVGAIIDNRIKDKVIANRPLKS